MASQPSPAQYSRPKSRNDFQIVIICALTTESSAVRAVFDEEWGPPSYGKLRNDFNSYTVGRIGRHNVVLAHLPAVGGVPSASSTASVALTYPAATLALLVGVCGGNPVGEDGKALFLGDIVISNSVVQYKYGRRYPEMLKRKDTLPDSLPRPNAEIRSFIHRMRTVQDRKRLAERTKLFLDDMLRTDEFADWTRPPLTTDTLFNSRYRHKHQKPGVCKTCDNWKEDRDEVCNVALKAYCADIGCDINHPGTRERLERAVERPNVHFGTVASADEVMKSGIDRDTIAAKELAIAFEMEGAGVWDNIPTVVIKSVCDYADSHKNKDWQQYASAVAACCMKAFLEEWFTTDNFTDTCAEIAEVAQSSTETEQIRSGHNTHQHRTSGPQSHNEEKQKEHEEELREALIVRESELTSMKDELEMARQRQIEQGIRANGQEERNKELTEVLKLREAELATVKDALEIAQQRQLEQEIRAKDQEERNKDLQHLLRVKKGELWSLRDQLKRTSQQPLEQRSKEKSLENELEQVVGDFRKRTKSESLTDEISMLESYMRRNEIAMGDAPDDLFVNWFVDLRSLAENIAREHLEIPLSPHYKGNDTDIQKFYDDWKPALPWVFPSVYEKWRRKKLQGMLFFLLQRTICSKKLFGIGGKVGEDLVMVEQTLVNRRSVSFSDFTTWRRKTILCIRHLRDGNYFVPTESIETLLDFCAPLRLRKEYESGEDTLRERIKDLCTRTYEFALRLRTATSLFKVKGIEKGMSVDLLEGNEYSVQTFWGSAKEGGRLPPGSKVAYTIWGYLEKRKDWDSERIYLEKAHITTTTR